MEQFLNSVQSVAVILLLTATGYFCAHAGWLTEEGKRFLNKFVITVAMPCTCVYGFTANLSRDMISQAYVLILISLVCIALSYALAILTAKLLRMPRKRFGVFVMMCAVSNSIFIGYAMCKELFGDVCTPYVMEFYMVNTVYTQVVGLAFVRWSGEAEPLSPRMALKILRSPPIIGIVLGYFLVLCELRLPGLVNSYCRYMNQIVSPLALLLTGRIIYETGLRTLRLERDVILVLIFRFLITPLMFYAACTRFHVPDLARSVLVIEAAMPVVTLSVVAASEYGADEHFAARSAAISTIGSFFVIPILMIFL